MSTLAALAGWTIATLCCAYALAALTARARRYRPSDPAPPCVGVSVLKPLFGAEERLEENLAALCTQDHPQFEILCGVRDPGDAAVPIVARVRERFPQVAISLVVDSRVYGTNLKVSNLINIEQRARYQTVVLADSDIAVESDYLRRVTAPLADPGVGIVTCLYRGRAVPSFWSRVGALFIDTWFAPSVRVASALGSDAFAFGATIALRRQTLRDGGGFEAVRNRLADDYWLGAIARRRGLATVLSEVEVITEVPETRVSQLWLREVRWLRTIRALNPVGFAFLFITFTLPMAGLAIAFSTSTATVTLAAIAILARLALQVHRVGWRRLWLAPVRDALLLLEWIAACGGDRVTWRDSTLGVDQRAPTVHDLPTPPAEASSAYRKQP